MTVSNQYLDWVADFEAPLNPLARRSFEDPAACFAGTSWNRVDFFSGMWKDPSHRVRIDNRTPLQVERDDILYSGEMRSQPEKFHVLFWDQEPILRSYTTHTLRMQQVARSICRGLRLNEDAADAMVLGSKLGAAPFIHASKGVICRWITDKLDEMARTKNAYDPLPRQPGTLPLDQPLSWTLVSNRAAQEILDSVELHMPWTRGRGAESLRRLYSSGATSLWFLICEPLRLIARGEFTNETLYGIWQHSLEDPNDEEHDPLSIRDGAQLSIEIEDLRQRPTYLPPAIDPPPRRASYTLSGADETLEAAVVRFADDVTWVIENLNDANYVARFEGAESLYLQAIENRGSRLAGVLSTEKAGRLYTHFLAQFVEDGKRALLPEEKGEFKGDVAKLRAARRGVDLSPSQELMSDLRQIKKFLRDEIWTKPRIHNRKRLLEELTYVALDLLYNAKAGELERIVDKKAEIGGWVRAETTAIKQRLAGDEVFRMQAAISAFVEMGDREVFSFLGVLRG